MNTQDLTWFRLKETALRNSLKVSVLSESLKRGKKRAVLFYSKKKKSSYSTVWKKTKQIQGAQWVAESEIYLPENNKFEKNNENILKIWKR